jgi:Sulfotransferase domain/N-terminal domain of galactosyltransferase
LQGGRSARKGQVAVKIVFCTTNKNRSFHLAQTLPKNLASNPRSKFVVLDYGSDNPDDVTAALDIYAKSDRVSLYRFESCGPFRMAHAKNMAHRLGILEGGDVLVNVDADNYLHDGYEDFVERVFEGGDALAGLYSANNANPAAISSVGGVPFIWSGHVRGKGKKLRGVSGRIAVTAEAFIKAGGYDEEKFKAWGHDDTDFNARLCFLGYSPIQTPIEYLECIPHGDGMRFREYPHMQPADPNGEDKPPPLAGTGIVNYGVVGCGEVRRAGSGESIKLMPVPTRIFGVGLHKTATTSLHAALKILGFDSAHWTNGNWARDIWNEMATMGKSPTLERSYAVSDLPISILYRELDKAYPGSKFILTVRNEVDWLRSVRDHWTYEKNPFRWEWDVYPFSNRIHQAVYGRKDFDTDVFLARYRRHNAEVKEYFRGRPDDLLVMEETKWDKLCSFFQRPVPAMPYPREFATAKR